MLRVVTIGTGWVSTHRHVPSLRRHPGVKLVGAVDHHAARAEDAGTRWRVPHATSLAEAPWARELDAVVIGTPPETHHGLVLDALARGLHVLVEKPFAMSPSQAREMIAAAARAGKVLAVVHNFQFARSVAAARRRIESGTAGDLKAVLGLQFSSHARRLPTWYKSLPLGLFYDEAPHLLYLVRSFAGELNIGHIHVSPSVRPDDATPRLVSATHEGRAVASVEMFFDTALSEWQLVLATSRETLVADIFRDILVRIPSDGGHGSGDILRTSLAVATGHFGGTIASGVKHLRGTLDYGNDEVVRRFVEAIRTGRPPQGISAQDGLAIVEAMAAVVGTATAGRSGSVAG